MGVQDRRRTWPGDVVAGDLDRPVSADVHDRDLRVRAGPVEAGEHFGSEQMCRHGVLGIFKRDHRCVLRHPAPHPVRDRMRTIRDAVQAGGLLGEHVDRTAAGAAVLARVDLVHERRAGASSAANEAYSSRRFVSLGTRSALAIFTDNSTPPIDAGSAGWHVSTSME